MKRWLLFIILFLQWGGLVCLGAEEFNGPVTEPLPYEELEFPEWAHDLRRFEVIFFGSVPLSYIVTNLVYDLSIYASHDFETEYRMGTARDQDDIEFMLLTSVSVSAGIAVLDYIIGQVKDRRADRKIRDARESEKQ